MDMDFSRYSRQILLPRVGIEGQKKINQASVLITGAGGLGSPIFTSQQRVSGGLA